MLAGIEDLTDKTIGTLKVLHIERRKPAFAWRTQCTQCGAVTVHLHQSLQSGAARCKNDSCGKVSTSSPASRVLTPVSPGVRSADSAERKTFEQSQRRIQRIAEVGHFAHPTVECHCADCKRKFGW